MFKKGLNLLAVIFLIQWGLSGFFMSCNPCGSFGEPEVFTLGSIIPIAEKVFTQPHGSGVSVNLGVEEFTNSDPRITFDSLGIRVNHEFLQIASNNSINGFYGGLYACSPTRGNIIVDQITSIDIISDTDYNTNYPQNTSLLEIIEAHFGNSLEALPISEYLTIETRISDGILFTLTEAPDEARIHNFTIRYQLEDGREFEALLNNVEILP